MRYFYKYICISIFFGLAMAGCGDNREEVTTSPDVDFTYTPESPVTGEEVTFEGEVNESSSNITSWEWNFGDDDETTTSGQTVTFTYDNAGSYDVILAASDNNENSVVVEHTVTVQESGGEAFAASIVWSFDTGSSVPNPNDASSPAIADDGTIYYVEGFAGEDSKVIAVNDNGDNAQLKWESATGQRTRQAPAIGPDGDIFIGNWTGDGINKIDSETGDVLWSSYTGQGVSNSTTAVDADGNIYFGTKGSAKGGIYSFGPNGTERWSILEIGDHYTSPALSNDGNTAYFFINSNGSLYAVNPTDGSQKWSSPVDISGGLGTSVSIDSDGTVYVTNGSEVVAVTDNGSDGSIKWSQSVEGPNHSGVVIGPEGDLYTGSEEGLVSLNPDNGSVNWVYDEIFVKESVPAVDSNGNIYIGSVDGKLSILSPSGSLLKEFSLGDNIVNSPVIADDGTVYVEAMDDDIIKLYKIEVEDSNGPADSNWPMKGQNRKNNGHS